MCVTVRECMGTLHAAASQQRALFECHGHPWSKRVALAQLADDRVPDEPDSMNLP